MGIPSQADILGHCVITTRNKVYATFITTPFPSHTTPGIVITHPFVDLLDVASTPSSANGTTSNG